VYFTLKFLITEKITFLANLERFYVLKEGLAIFSGDAH